MSMSTSEDMIADKSLGDLPPEVMTKVLEWLTVDETRNNVLSLRLVNHLFKDILDDLIEKKLESGRLQPFPTFKIGGEPTKLLQVRCSPTVFRGDGDSFLFNSVLLSGNAELNFMPGSATNIQMELPVFFSEFGGNLTSFALCDQKIPVSTLVAMIGSLPWLKFLLLMNVLPEDSVIKPDAVLPTPPPLPNLAVLEVKSGPLNRRARGVDKKRNILYIWLIASYANQLVRLNLDTDDTFPPLQIQHQYSISLPNDKIFRIGTTSDSAFGNLKEISVSSPSRNFLTESETPALQQLSVSGLYFDFDLRHLLLFCVKCGDTLEKFKLDVRWDYLEMFHFLSYDGQLQSTEGATIPKLKTLAIHYPSEDSHEIILNEMLLVMVPALEVLQLLHFHPHDIDDENPCGGGNDLGGADNDIVALKERYALLCKQHQHLRCCMPAAPPKRNAWQRIYEAGKDLEEFEDIYPDEIREFDYHTQQLCRHMSRVEAERNAVLRRLAALGETREKVMVEQLLERREIWNTCPNLKIVTVSSSSKPDGDICCVRKPNDA